MNSNDYQIGGGHYKTRYEHWDLILKCDLDYLLGCSTKYVVRLRQKGGAQDVKKALHYLNKRLEGGVRSRTIPYTAFVQEVVKFNAANPQMGDLERAFIAGICTWREKLDLEEAREHLLALLDELENAVPLTEENHHADRVGSSD